jgi:hypothetical protein
VPNSEFYGIRGSLAGPAVRRVQQICADRDRSAWASVYEALALIRPAPRLDTWAQKPIDVEKEPLAHVDRYLNLPAISADEPPNVDDPSLRWLLTELTLLSAELRYRGKDDGFNGTFTDGLAIPSRYSAEADKAEFVQFVDRLFQSTATFPAPFGYLKNADTYCAYLPNADLKILLDVESNVGLLSRVSDDLARSSDNLSRIYGEEIRRMLHFLALVHLSGLDLYYREFAT